MLIIDLVKLYFDEPFKTNIAVEAIAKDVISGKYRILEVIEALKDKIISTDTNDRSKVCKLLEEILGVLPHTILSSLEISSLCEFFCGKLKDHHSLHPAVLKCLFILSRNKGLNADDGKNIITTLFREVLVQSCFQSVRAIVYQLLINMCESYSKVVISLGDDFIYNLIQVVEGEQEPRNLLLVFELWYQVLTCGVYFYGFREEIFEVVSCYFPIDFNPPSDGQFSVTSEELVSTLRNVLSSTSAFAEYCIPLMLENIKADSNDSKVDAILTLKKSILKYKKKDLEPFLSSIWYILKREIQQSISSDVEVESLSLLTELIRIISSWKNTMTNSVGVTLKDFLQDIFDDCLPSIKQQKTDKQAWMSYQILIACLKGSFSSCDIIIGSILPLVVNELEEGLKEVELNPDSLIFMLDKIQTPLNIIVDILTSIKKKNYKVEYIYNWNSILSLLITIMDRNMKPQLTCTAVVCIAAYISAGLCSIDKLEKIIEKIVDEVIEKGCNEKLCHELALTCGIIVECYPNAIKGLLLPAIKVKLNKNEENIDPSLNLLCSICNDKSVLEDVVSMIVEKIQSENNYSRCEDFLKCLQKITKECSGCSSLVKLCVLPLIKMYIEETLLETHKDKKHLSDLKLLSSIVYNCCIKLKRGEDATSFTDLILDIFLNGNTSAIDIKSEDKLDFKPFDGKNSPISQVQSVHLITSVICSLSPQIEISHIETLKEKLLKLLFESLDQPTYVTCSKAISSLVNKSSNITKNEEYISQIESELNASSNTTCKDFKLRQLTLTTWITKALAMRNHKKTGVFIDRLIKLFSDKDVGEIAAACFDIIMHESEEVLSSSSHAVKKLMYKQRFFSIFMPKLHQFFDSNNFEDDKVTCDTFRSKTKANCLSALSHVLAYMPQQALIMQMKQLLPLLVHSLKSHETVFLKSVLTSLFSLMKSAPDVMKSHVDTLMKDFLRLTTYAESLEVRRESIRCVGISCIFPPHIILPLKIEVLKKLSEPLNDPKRAVRSEAAKARSQWFLLGS